MDIFKLFGGQALLAMIPGLLTQLAVKLQDKDDDDVGTDDASAHIILAVAPMIPALMAKDENVKKKVLKTAYNAIGGYLGYPAK